MGKRSSFERIERDFYPTPKEAVLPLLAHLSPGTRFCEPCAGNGALIDHLTEAGHACVDAWDIAPQRGDIKTADARNRQCLHHPDLFITNPPWLREVLHEIIANLSDQYPTWLLFDADWSHTRQAAPYMPYLRKIVSVGRVKWIPGSKFTGKDNCAWHLFDQTEGTAALFFGRAA